MRPLKSSTQLSPGSRSRVTPKIPYNCENFARLHPDFGTFIGVIRPYSGPIAQPTVSREPVFDIDEKSGLLITVKPKPKHFKKR